MVRFTAHVSRQRLAKAGVPYDCDYARRAAFHAGELLLRAADCRADGELDPLWRRLVPGQQDVAGQAHPNKAGAGQRIGADKAEIESQVIHGHAQDGRCRDSGQQGQKCKHEFFFHGGRIARRSIIIR